MSTLKVDTLQTSDGVEVYTAKVWVNFNGTGTIAIRGSGNVSSLTDNGTGDYTINFTAAMPDANYSVVIAARGAGSTNRLTYSIAQSTAPTASACRVVAFDTGATATVDTPLFCVSVFR